MLLRLLIALLSLIIMSCNPIDVPLKTYSVTLFNQKDASINAAITTTYTISCTSVFGGTTNFTQTGFVITGPSGTLQILQNLGCTITITSFFDGTTTYTPAASPLVITVTSGGTISSSGSFNSPPRYNNGSSNLYLFLASSTSSVLNFEYSYDPALQSITLVNPCVSNYCGSKPSFSSITTSFNGLSILLGSHIWYTSNIIVTGLDPTAITNIYFTEATASFTSIFTYTVNLPDAVITLTPNVSCGTTTYSQNMWQTVFPTSLVTNNNIFAQGGALAAGIALVGGITGVTYQARIYADKPNVTISWQWGAAIYSTSMTNYATLSIKSAKQNDCTYNNTDPAGTPENKKANLAAGGTGSGGSQYTGGQTTPSNVTPSGCAPACTGSNVRCPAVCQAPPITL